MIARLDGTDFIAKEVTYHHSCHQSYLMKAEKLQCTKSVKTEQHDNTFSNLKEYISATLIENHGTETLTSLQKRYLELLGSEDSSTYPAHSLASKILKTFPSLSENKKTNKAGVVIYFCELSEKEVFHWASLMNTPLKTLPCTFVN